MHEISRSRLLRRISSLKNVPWWFGGLVLSVLFAAQRLWVTLSGRCVLDADEGIVLLAAQDILSGQLPVFFYAQDYLGSFQSFAAVPVVALLGATPLALRITAILEGIAILWMWRWILRKWGAPEIFPIYALLLAFGAEFMTIWTLRSRGGIETLLLGSLWIAVATSILCAEKPSAVRWFSFGLVTGIAWWTSQLSVFFFVPGLLLFLSMKQGRFRLTRLNIRGEETGSALDWVLGVVYVLAVVLLFARGTIPYQSPLSLWLLRSRGILLVLFSIILILYVARAVYRHRLPFPLLFGTGALIGYLPALSVVLVKEQLYNTTSINRAMGFWSHMLNQMFLSGGTMIGIDSESFASVGLPVLGTVFLVGVYAASIFLFYLDFLRSWRQEKTLSHFNVFVAWVVPVSLLIFTHVECRTSEPPRYALFLLFMVSLAVAWLFLNIRRISPWAAWVVLAAFLVANCVSVFRRERVPIVQTTMVTQADQMILDFLTENNISAACTSLDSPGTGYWDAYRLSASSGGRIGVHPILHMPRIERFRAALEKAERCAIVTRDPILVEGVFRRQGISFSRFDQGGMSVLWDFDKVRVDELGLIDYRRTLRDKRFIPSNTDTQTRSVDEN